MANRDRENHTARNLALFGGSAFLFWLLLRGKGWGLDLGGKGAGLAGGEGDHSGAGAGANTASASAELPPSSVEPIVPCRVQVRAEGIKLDGVMANLPTVVARCRAAGHAEVTATGDAIVRTIGEVVRAIETAGAVVHAPPDVWRSAKVTEAGTP